MKDSNQNDLGAPVFMPSEGRSFGFLAERMDAPLRNLLFHPILYGLLAFAFVVYGIAFVGHMGKYFTLINYLRDVNCDDSFYYCQVAKNAARGVFSSADGVNLTNGYHPLWALVLVPVYLLKPDVIFALLDIKTLEIVLLVMAALAVVWSAWRLRLPWVLLVGLLPSYMLNKGLYHGMEAGLHLLVLALLLPGLVLVFDSKRPRIGAAVLGIALALVPWVRTESIAVSWFVAAALTMVVALRIAEIPRASLYMAVSAAMGSTFVYFSYNYFCFGLPVPISGLVKSQVHSSATWQTGDYCFAKALTDYWNADIYRENLVISFVVLAVAGVAIMLTRWRPGSGRKWIPLDVFMSALAVGHIAKLLHGVLFMPVGLVQEYWLFVPAYLLKALFWPYVVVRIFAWLEWAMRERQPVGRHVAILVTAVWLATLVPFLWPFQWVREVAEKRWADWEIGSFLGTEYANENLPEGAVIGSRDSGVISYFCRHRVINMDGLMNSKAYYGVLRRDERGQWLRRSGITHLMNVVPDGARWQAVFGSRSPGENSPSLGTAELLYKGDAVQAGGRRYCKIWSYNPDRPSERIEGGGSDPVGSKKHP